MTPNDPSEKKTESEFSPESATVAPQNLPDPLNWRESRVLFLTIVRDLIGTDQPSSIAAFLGPQVKASTIRDWRRGACGIPSWAIAKVSAALGQREQTSAQLRARLSTMPAAPGRLADIASKRRGDRWAHKRKSPAP